MASPNVVKNAASRLKVFYTRKTPPTHVMAMLSSEGLSQRDASAALQKLKDEKAVTPAIAHAYLRGTARRGDQYEFDKAKQQIITDYDHSSPVEWRDLTMQIHAAHKRFGETMEILHSIITDKKAQQIIPEDFAFILQNLGTSGDRLEKLSKLWQDLLDGGVKRSALVRHTFIKLTAFHNIDAAVGHLTKAIKDRVPLDEQMFMNVIGPLARYGNTGAVQFLLAEMKKLRIKPTMTTFNNLLNADARRGDTEGVNYWLKEIQKEKLKPDVMTFNCLIHGAAKNNDNEGVLWWLGEMKRLDVKPNATTYGPVIGMAAKSGDMQIIQMWINELIQQNLRPNLSTFHFLIQAASEQGNTEMVQHWVKEMKNEGLEATTTIFVMIINMAVKRGDLNSARYWVNEMKKRKMNLDEVPFNNLVKSAAKEGDKNSANFWLHEMVRAGVTPQYFTFMALNIKDIQYDAWLTQLKYQTK